MPIIKRPLGVTKYYNSKDIVDAKDTRQVIPTVNASSVLNETHTSGSGISNKHYQTKINKLPGKNGQIFTSGESFSNLPSGINDNVPTKNSIIEFTSSLLASKIGEDKIDKLDLNYNSYSQYYQVERNKTIAGTDQPKIDTYLPKDLDTFVPSTSSFKTIPLDTTENASRFMGISNVLIKSSGSKFNNDSSQIISSTNENNTGVTINALNNKSNDNNTNIIPLGAYKDINGNDQFRQIENYNITPIERVGDTIPVDFRASLRNTVQNNATIGTAPLSPNYKDDRIETRVRLGDPGRRFGKNLLNYADGIGRGKVYGQSGGNASIDSYDKINVLPIYASSTADQQKGNDLVKFRIGVINNDAPSQQRYIHFRAFLDTITDSFTSEWQDSRYIGRGEKFYTYNGFDRTFSLSWTVAAQSKAELIPMYKKLNYLASICAPDYNGNGYMRGNIVTLTVGGYFYEQPGIIKGITYTMNEETHPWEIGIDTNGNSDSTVKELPHIIKVSGFQFIPIHTFTPRLQNNKYGASSELNDGNVYGQERYIHLDRVPPDGWKSSPYNNYGPINEPPVQTPPPASSTNVNPNPKYTPPTLTTNLQDVSGNRAIEPTTGRISGDVNLNPVNNGSTGVVNDRVAALTKNNPFEGGSIQYVNGKKVLVKNKKSVPSF